MITNRAANTGSSFHGKILHKNTGPDSVLFQVVWRPNFGHTISLLGVTFPSQSNSSALIPRMEGLTACAEDEISKKKLSLQVDAVMSARELSSDQSFIAFALVKLPSPPLGAQPDEVTIKRIENYHRTNNEERDIVTTIKNYKSFLNPYKLKEVVDYFRIDETASEYPKEKFGHSYDENESVDAILARLMK